MLDLKTCTAEDLKTRDSWNGGMSEELYPYYQSELYFIRKLAQEFARKYPVGGGARCSWSRIAPPTRTSSASSRRSPSSPAASATSCTTSSPN